MALSDCNSSPLWPRHAPGAPRPGTSSSATMRMNQRSTVSLSAPMSVAVGRLDNAPLALHSGLLDLQVGQRLRLDRKLVGKAVALGLPSFVVRGAELGDRRRAQGAGAELNGVARTRRTSSVSYAKDHRTRPRLSRFAPFLSGWPAGPFSWLAGAGAFAKPPIPGQNCARFPPPLCKPALESDTPSTTLAFAQACDLMRRDCRRAHDGIVSAPSACLRDPGHVAGRLRTGLGTIGSVRLAIISGENHRGCACASESAGSQGPF